MNITTAQATEEVLQPLSAKLIQVWLQELGVHLELGKIIDVCGALRPNSGGEQSYLEQCLAPLELNLGRPLEIPWHRLDLGKLPALIRYEQQWYLAKAEGNGNCVLIDNELMQKEVAIHILQDASASVYWVPIALGTHEIGLKDLPSNSAAKLVMSELKKYKASLVDIAVATVVVNVLAVATSLFAMQVYDRVVPTLAFETLTTLVVGMFIVIALTWALKRSRAIILDTIGAKMDNAVSKQVFDHISQLSLADRPRNLGTLAAQVNGLDSVRNFFSSSIVFGIIDLPFALMFIAFIGVIGGPIAYVYCAFLPIAIILGLYTQRRIRALLKEKLALSSERQGMLVDFIQGQETIRSANASWRFSKLWQYFTNNIALHSLKHKRSTSFSSLTIASLSSAAYVLAIVVGVFQIESGNLTMGALIACSILGNRVIQPISRSVQLVNQWQNVSQSLALVSRVLDLKTVTSVKNALRYENRRCEHLTVEDITFSYPGSPVKQLSIDRLSFKAGERVAILGAIGSAKSTLLKVLSGVYQPTTGRVKLDDFNLNELDPISTAEQLSYLPQSVRLFKGTLKDNLTISGIVSDDELVKIMTALGVDRIVADREKGLDLPISEGGDGLSGGQQQLVGLARVFIAAPTVWLLDEPTASLDAQTELKVIQAINQAIKPDDILIFSTHKPQLAKQLASRSIIMKQGEIVFDGSTQDMMKRNQPAAPNRQNLHNKGGLGHGGF